MCTWLLSCGRCYLMDSVDSWTTAGPFSVKMKSSRPFQINIKTIANGLLGSWDPNAQRKQKGCGAFRIIPRLLSWNGAQVKVTFDV